MRYLLFVCLFACSSPENAAEVESFNSQADAVDAAGARKDAGNADPHPSVEPVAVFDAGLTSEDASWPYAFLGCTDDSQCTWFNGQNGGICTHENVQINLMTSRVNGPALGGAVATTITSPPFHGLCFSAPGDPTPLWCEAITPVGKTSQLNTLFIDSGDWVGNEDIYVWTPPTPAANAAWDEMLTVTTFVSLGKDLAGSPKHDWEVCYLDGTLDAPGAGTAGCTEMSGYCCFAPRPLPKPDPGNPFFSIAPGDYWFAFHTFPDMSRDGPVPFASWGSNGVTTPEP